MLGETPLPSAQKSVFEFLSEKDRERIKNIAAGGTPSAPAVPPPTTSSYTIPSIITIPHLPPNIASSALKGFQPFTSNPSKQSLYTYFLQSQAEPDTPVGEAALARLKPNAKEGQTVEAFNLLLEEFKKSAEIFRPVSGAMAGRFTSSGATLEMGMTSEGGLSMPSKDTASSTTKMEEEERPKEEEELSPKAHAAKMGMYGPLTRETIPWQPAKLLCKRFGVKDPDPMPQSFDDLGGGSATAGKEFTSSGFSDPSSSSMQSGGNAGGTGAEAAAPDMSFDGPRDLNNIGLGEDDTQGRDTLTYQRPGMDIFKAIFASDDEDSDDEKDEKDEKEKEMHIDEPPPLPSAEESTLVAAAPAQKKEEPVDPATFKPKFIPRDGKAPANGSGDSEKTKSKDKDKKEKKKKDKVLVSFAMDEDGGADGPMVVPDRDKPKKKKKKKDKKTKEDDDDEGMWVEKPAVVASLPLPDGGKSEITPPSTETAQASGTGSDMAFGPAAPLHKGRKRAIDFM
jgi:G patch domain-containing protein 1